MGVSGTPLGSARYIVPQQFSKLISKVEMLKLRVAARMEMVIIDGTVQVNAFPLRIFVISRVELATYNGYLRFFSDHRCY